MKTFIIAEAGINHNGDVGLAKKMIDAAANVGADAVKFQTFWGIKNLEKYELDDNEWDDLYTYCRDKNIMFLSTPHTIEAIDFLDKYVPIYKVASPHITNKNFIKNINSMGKSVFFGTGSLKHEDGMATLEEIKATLGWLDNVPLAIPLHCVSKYPCDDPRYDRIEEIKTLTDLVGLSDHSKNIRIPKCCVIERHFMLEYSHCIDESVSLTPNEFREMVNWLKST